MDGFVGVNSGESAQAKAILLPLPQSRQEWCNLTPRQLECLQWAGEGKSSTDIASILNLSPATVDGYVAEACRRLGVRTRIQAIVEAYRKGWLR